MNHFRRKPGYGQISKSILETIADFFIEDHKYGVHYGPQLDYILAVLIKMVIIKNRNAVSKTQINRTLNDLEKRDIISLDRRGEDIYVTLQERGQKKIAKYSLQKILEYKNKSKTWDGKWFMVFFDVPEQQRKKRNYLRTFLKEIGFYQYQLSVYVFPYDCYQEFLYIKSIIESAKYAKYIIAEKIEDEHKIRKYFKL